MLWLLNHFLPMVRSAKKLHAIYSQLRQEILAGEWAVGTKLPKEAEIARRFECSLGTVSKALSLLVHENLLERRARAGTTVIHNTPNAQPTGTQLDALAFIYPSEQHEGIWRTVKGFQDAACDTQRRVVMLPTGSDYKKEAEFIARLSEFDVRGAVVYPIISTPQDQVHFSQMLVNSKFPVVLAEVNLPGLGCSSVIMDGFHIGHTMTCRMIERGASRIGYFSNNAQSPFMRDRYLGYRWALQEAGLTEPEVYLDPEMHPDFKNPLAEPTKMAEAYLGRAKSLEAVVCANDFLALGCIAVARNMGLKVPGDLLVSGVDDYTSLASSVGIALTTYRVPFEEIGRKAFEILSSVSQGAAPYGKDTLIRGTIVVRETA